MHSSVFIRKPYIINEEILWSCFQENCSLAIKLDFSQSYQVVVSFTYLEYTLCCYLRVVLSFTYSEYTL